MTKVYKWLPCALWDIAGLQDWLNRQARAGYALEKWPGWSFMGRIPFRRDPAAVRARYCLDPIGERIGDAELRDRAASYGESGWEYVGRIGKLYAIYRCDDPEAPALYSDPQSLAWAMKKQVRWSWISLFFWLLWAAVLFRDEWPLLLRWPGEVLLELILRAEILVPLYGILLVCVLNVVSYGIGIFRGIRRTRACLRRGEWPPAGPRRYPEVWRTCLTWVVLAVFLLVLVYLGVSGARHTRTLESPAEWDFPHVTLEEALPPGTALRAYSRQEMLHRDTFDHSFLAPEQYDVAQGGMAVTPDGARQDTRLYQESVRAASPALTRAVYQGRLAAHRHALEEYRVNWEENASTLHPDLPDAYVFLEEEALSHPGLDALTCFTYQFSDEAAPDTVWIGLAGDRVFVLNCSGAVDSAAALSLLTERLAADG